MKIVEVIKIPVRYDGETYSAGDTFEMEDEHVNESIVKVIGEAEPKTLEEMTVPELKKYAAKNEIDISGLKKKDDILEAIQTFEAGDGEENGQEDGEEDGEETPED